MMTQYLLPDLRKTFVVWFGILAVLNMITACGGGGGGGASSTPPAHAPTVSISSPTTSTSFKEGENITFSGTATDTEDGQLTGKALVWTSNVDGKIGKGETLITSALSAGDHDITLTATDSSGKSATDTQTITVAQTRFIKMGAQTTAVTDASNAFDGDTDTAATIMAPNTEVIYFKAHIGADNKFFFKIKTGAVSTSGSKLAIEGLAADGTWQYVTDVFLLNEKTTTLEVINAQDFVDTEGYINLRAFWVNGQTNDTVAIYEIWRIDPPYAGKAAQSVTNADAAFDENKQSFATISKPWNPLSDPPEERNFLYVKIYVGVGICNTLKLNILMNDIGPSHSFAIDVDDLSTSESNDWKLVETLELDTSATQTISIENVQKYLDQDGYIRLRGSWITVSTDDPGKALNVYEIWRINPFILGPKTANDPAWILNPQNAIDGDPNSAAIIYYFWGEGDRYDFLHLQAYVGDESNFTFSIQSAPNTPGYESMLVVEGESNQDVWSEIERISLDAPTTTVIELTNARQFVDENGLLSLRVRWESDSFLYDTLIYEVQHEED